MLHVALLVLLAWIGICFWFGGKGIGCIMHDWLHLYCPFCGGTRAIGYLLRLDVVNAWRCHPLVVLFAPGGLVLDAIAWERVIRDRPLFSLPGWIGWGMLGLFFAFGILRNYLMLTFGIDPIGDLGCFWN